MYVYVHAVTWGISTTLFDIENVHNTLAELCKCKIIVIVHSGTSCRLLQRKHTYLIIYITRSVYIMKIPVLRQTADYLYRFARMRMASIIHTHRNNGSPDDCGHHTLTVYSHNPSFLATIFIMSTIHFVSTLKTCIKHTYSSPAIIYIKR